MHQTAPMMSMRPWREGLAKKSDGPGWAWVVGYLALGIGESLSSNYEHGLWWLSVGAAVAFAGGAVWQALYRRDLADRLVVLSSLFVVGMLVVLIPGSSLEKDSGTGAGMGGLVAGLVLTEQWLRRRDRAA